MTRSITDRQDQSLLIQVCKEIVTVMIDGEDQFREQTGFRAPIKLLVSLEMRGQGVPTRLGSRIDVAFGFPESHLFWE